MPELNVSSLSANRAASEAVVAPLDVLAQPQY